MLPPIRPVYLPADAEPGSQKAPGMHLGWADPDFAWTGAEDWIPQRQRSLFLEG